MKISFPDSLKTQCLLILAVSGAVLAWTYSPFWNLGFSHDDLVFLQAMNAPLVGSWEFVQHILFYPNSYNTHYRPLGFFGYFFFLGRFFGPSPLVFDFFGSFVFLSNTILALMLSRKLLKDRVDALLLTACYSVHLGALRIFLNYSDHVKYGVSCFILLLGLNLASSVKTIKLKTSAFLTLSVFVAIGCHEAAFTFSFVFILFRWVFLRKKEPVLLIALLPTFLYLGMRLFVWGVPDSGYFAVDWAYAPVFFVQQIGFFLFPDPSPFSKDSLSHFMIVSLGAVLILAAAFWKIRQHRDEAVKVLFLFGTWVFMQIPYAPIYQHWEFARKKAMIWPTFLFLLGIALLLQQQSSLLRRGFYFLSFGVFFVGSQNVLQGHIQRKTFDITTHQVRLLEQVGPQVSGGCEKCVFQLSDIDSLIDPGSCEAVFTETYAAPALLALTYPESSFDIRLSASSPYRWARIFRGYVYYQPSRARDESFVDVFGFQYNEVPDLDLEASGKVLKLNPPIWTCK